MRYYHIAVLSLLISCNNNNKQTGKQNTTQADETAASSIKKQTNNPSGTDNTISFVIGGNEEVTLKADVMLNEINGKQTLTIGTGGREAKQHLVIDWDEPGESATSFDEQGKYGHPKAVYHPDIAGNISNRYQFKNGGLLDITAIDLRKGGHISGTFEAAAVNKEGHLISISKGKINNAKIQGGVFTTK
jgi:hypothetical protein